MVEAPPYVPRATRRKRQPLKVVYTQILKLDRLTSAAEQRSLHSGNIVNNGENWNALFFVAMRPTCW